MFGGMRKKKSDRRTDLGRRERLMRRDSLVKTFKLTNADSVYFVGIILPR